MRNVNVWNNSSIICPKETDSIEWSKLKPEQRMKFEESYVKEAARMERMRVFRHATQERQHRLVNLLHTYQTARQARFKKQEMRVKDAEEQARAYLDSEIFMAILEGDWKTIQWLADYGKKHCEKGLRASSRADASGGFPPPEQALKADEGIMFPALVLQTFAAEAGITVEETFREPSFEAPELRAGEPIEAWLPKVKSKLSTKDETDFIPVNRRLTNPQRLPFKATLRELVLAKWARLNGAKGASLRKSFSRQLNALGLGGLLNLPRGVKVQMRPLRQKCIEDFG
jgi:hypothetical protein